MTKTLATALTVLAMLFATPTLADATPVPAVDTTVATPTPVKVKVKDGSAKFRKVTTTAATVGDLLTELGITLGEQDVVKPTVETAIRKHLKVRIARISTSTSTVTEVVPFPEVKQKNPDLARGKKNILVAGVVGSAERTYQVTTVNGRVKVKTLVSENVLLAPVTQVVEVGTTGKALNLAHLRMWNRIARCESGGRWHINTGNGYYGGLQFNLGTWRSSSGRDFASYPHKASKAEQITVANRLYAKRGTRPWGCA